MSKKGILHEGVYLDERYDYLNEFANMIMKGYWTPAKYERGMKKDALHVKKEMSLTDKSFIGKNALCVAMIEDKVKMGWTKIGWRIPQTMVSDVTMLIAMQEVVHRRSYHSLNKELDINVNDIERYPVLKERLDYLNKHLSKDPNIKGRKETLKDITLFSALVERGGLMSYFYNVMSYANANKGLGTMFALQKTTAVEEDLHYHFGLALINEIKKDYPELWDEYLVELVGKSLQVAYDTEIRIVDWLLEDGIPDHITREEMINYIQYNFYMIQKDLGVPITVEYDKDLYAEKNSWMKVAMYQSEPDFFAKIAGGYSAEEEDIDIDSFKF